MAQTKRAIKLPTGANPVSISCLHERLVLVLELLGVDFLLLGEGLEALVVAVEDVLEEAGEDHAGGGAALAHLAVEDARRVGVLLPHLGEHRVEVDLAGGLLVHNRQSGDGLSTQQSN